jgi:hypothetical protein
MPATRSTATGKCFLDMLGVFAEFETNLRRERQLEGIAKAKVAGVYKGRPASMCRSIFSLPSSKARRAARYRLLFDAASEDANSKAFAERCKADRHHFRFTVSPEDAKGDEQDRGFGLRPPFSHAPLDHMKNFAHHHLSALASTIPLVIHIAQGT